MNRRTLLAISLLAALAGCGGALSGADLEASYAAALEHTRDRADPALTADPERLAAAVSRVEAFFRSPDPESVRVLARTVYADDAYLNDTLAALTGVDAIEDYFAEAVAGDRALTVEFLDTAVSGIDVYVRWRMDMTVPALNRGEPIVSHGITQFRFDAAGKVVLHKDFWDSAAGFYEQLPAVGRLIRRLRPN